MPIYFGQSIKDQKEIHFNGKSMKEVYLGPALVWSKPAVNEILDPDFLVLRFYWTTADGTDLDSLTVFSASGITGLDGTPVGWRGGGLVKFLWMNILFWAGDNQDSGNESVLIDLKELRKTENQPYLLEESIIDIYGNWYVQKLNGNCSIELKAYAGGTMSKSGYVYINTSGSLLTTQSFDKVIATSGKTGYLTYDTGGYTKLGSIKYIKSTGNATLIF